MSIWDSHRLTSVSSLAKPGTLLVLRWLRLEYLRERAGWPWESSEVLDLAACCSQVLTSTRLKSLGKGGSCRWEALKMTRLVSLVKGRFPSLGRLEEGSAVGEPEDAAALERC